MKKELPKKLKELRERKDVSLRVAARNMGINHSYLHRLEKGDSVNPTGKLIRKMAKYYNVSEQYLLTDQDEWYDSLPRDLKQYVKRENIEYLNLSLDIKESDLTPEEVREVIKTLKKIKNQ